MLMPFLSLSMNCIQGFGLTKLYSVVTNASPMLIERMQMYSSRLLSVCVEDPRTKRSSQER